MKKRGLSGIVTVILIILLVLVAIGIIWAAIRPPIQETGDRLSGDCLTLNVEALSCTNMGNGLYDVRFMRNAGAGSLTDVKIIFYNIDDETTVVEYGSTLTELQTGLYNSGDLSSFAPTQANVVAVIQPGETPITCEIVNQPVSCLTP
ncbi:hypothetical protein CO038_00940 [Candidatus Pacearchaeota archaeon CG_4_9_14_0_2_um_filter_39_13]|nr:hypothetical protein [Candidatus Pacearchaeota archaeon]OIO42933.1 MAG: hypothetical protein AUJ64_03105 [Candidatus Pacearchaeota archaeon CG1_02_39_14]PJC45001.1 MAG: hypothetical protein CO038_00940 [Candidatus Pacearchaeota archaeon CG_4_9_14_0_2_um_filter_39_13]